MLGKYLAPAFPGPKQPTLLLIYTTEQVQRFTKW